MACTRGVPRCGQQPRRLAGCIVDNLPVGTFEFHGTCGVADKVRRLSERIALHEFDGEYGLTGFFGHGGIKLPEGVSD